MPEITTLVAAIAAAVAPYEEPQNSARTRALPAPPLGAAVGDRYVVAAAGSGAWSGHDHEIAQLEATGWAFLAPSEGTTLWIDDEDVLATWDGAGWSFFSSDAVYVADEPLSALRAVRLATLGHVVYARPPELEAQAPLGITTRSSAAGDRVAVAQRGELCDAGWAWTAGAPVLLGLDGVLTQLQPPALPHLVVMGHAIATDTIIIRISPPILIAA